MKTYKNLYPKLCSYKNLEKAFKKARKGKTKTLYVKEFEKNKIKNILELKNELQTLTYNPLPLKKFIIRDPKTRVIRKSCFKDRIVHHAVVNILEPIYEKIFIHDSYANRKNKGTHEALKRFDVFKRKISKNGCLVKNPRNNNMVKGYVLKADIKQFFDSINHSILIHTLKKKIRDNSVLWLINRILENFHNKEKGMPLGNMTSQFFANVYLNNFDYFIKQKLKIKYYIRYVDDFVIFYSKKSKLHELKEKIILYLKNLKLELHQDKSKIIPISKGINFLGFKIFYHYKLIIKRNINHFKRNLKNYEKLFKNRTINEEKIIEATLGWFAYARWGNTHNLINRITKNIIKLLSEAY